MQDDALVHRQIVQTCIPYHQTKKPSQHALISHTVTYNSFFSCPISKFQILRNNGSATIEEAKTVINTVLQQNIKENAGETCLL
jgi:hypothetical protein